MLQNPHALLTIDKVHNPLHLPRETTSERPRVVRTCSVFNMLTSTCASRRTGVHFFDITISKSGPNPSVFFTFDLEMCFVPQRHALFRHHNFEKWSELMCFVHFDLHMCFAPQRSALFHHLNFQKWSELLRFVHLGLQMCFAPQVRALFHHLNFQKRSEPGVFCTF